MCRGSPSLASPFALRLACRRTGTQHGSRSDVQAETGCCDGSMIVRTSSVVLLRSRTDGQNFPLVHVRLGRQAGRNINRIPLIFKNRK